MTTTTERGLTLAAQRAHAEQQFNAAVAALPAALAALGNTTGLDHLSRVARDRLAAPLDRLRLAGASLHRVVHASVAHARHGTPLPGLADIDAAHLALAAWAIATADDFGRALEFFSSSATREDAAEEALQASVVDSTAWPWAELFALIADARQAGQQLDADTRLDCRGLLRGHTLDMDALRAAGPAGATLAARADFECRRELSELRRIGGGEPLY